MLRRGAGRRLHAGHPRRAQPVRAARPGQGRAGGPARRGRRLRAERDRSRLPGRTASGSRCPPRTGRGSGRTASAASSPDGPPSALLLPVRDPGADAKRAPITFEEPEQAPPLAITVDPPAGTPAPNALSPMTSPRGSGCSTWTPDYGGSRTYPDGLLVRGERPGDVPHPLRRSAVGLWASSQWTIRAAAMAGRWRSVPRPNRAPRRWRNSSWTAASRHGRTQRQWPTAHGAHHPRMSA